MTSPQATRPVERQPAAASSDAASLAATDLDGPAGRKDTNLPPISPDVPPVAGVGQLEDLALDLVPPGGRIVHAVPDEDHDNAFQDSDEALPDDLEEVAIARDPSREGTRFDED